MNEQLLRERKAALQQELEAAVNHANKCLGAIGEVDYWLTKLAERASALSAEIGGTYDDNCSVSSGEGP